MKLILSDVNRDWFQTGDENTVIIDNGKIHHCVGCFQCWIKTPGKCVILDGYQDMGKQLSRCAELIIISQCVYGSTSPFIKNVMDRAISYIHPNFCYRNGEMHHKRRYSNRIKITAYFYGNQLTEAEKATASKLVKANAVNYDGEVNKVVFLNGKEELRGIAI